jgi:RNA polymerase sigma-70 factor (ECF subfamily)
MEAIMEADRRAAYLERYDATVGAVFSYLYRACNGERQRAEDLTQETFAAALKAWEKDPDQEMTLPWLLTIARHKMIDGYRKLDRQTRGVTQLRPAEVMDPIALHSDRETIRECLRRLPSMQRAVIALRFLDDLPVDEVARELGKRRAAIESLQRRALSQLRTMLEEHDDEH